MATYGIDGTTKEKVEVYSKSEIDGKFAKIVVNSVSVTGGGVSTVLNVDYPEGFNKNNCVVISEMSTDTLSNMFTTPNSYYSKGIQAYIHSMRTTLDSDDIAIVLQNAETTTMKIKVVLMKI